MQIAIYGPGAIGSTFAYQLAKAGHAVTVVARGARLAQLQRDKAIVLESGETATVQVAEALEPQTPYDLVLVTVLAHQVEAVLPALKASAAKTVMFMFNTFDSLAPLRDAVGAQRFAFGFPSVIAYLVEGRLRFRIVTSGQITTVSDPAWARVFTEAGIGTVAHDDMQNWLRTHVAFVYPLMALAAIVHTRKAGITWAEATAGARALKAGYALVRKLGSRPTPSNAAMLGSIPQAAAAPLLWLLSRTSVLRNLGTLGPAEPRALADQMTAAAPGQTAEILAIRPS